MANPITCAGPLISEKEPRHLLRFAITLLVPLLLLSVSLRSVLQPAYAANGPEAQQRHDEYHLKAAYLYNFTKFIIWPTDAFPADDAPLNICVDGEMPGPEVVEKLSSKKTRGHPLRVLDLNEVNDPAECHVVYFRQVDRDEVHRVTEQIRNHPVLTVGEYKGFARDDGIVEFEITDSRRIRLIINPARAKDLRITISAQLLEIASVLGGQSNL